MRILSAPDRRPPDWRQGVCAGRVLDPRAHPGPTVQRFARHGLAGGSRDNLSVFDRYTFTVKEDEPLEKEVAVDPEMLGKVFENLLEVKDRKSKGTYYLWAHVSDLRGSRKNLDRFRPGLSIVEPRVRAGWPARDSRGGGVSSETGRPSPGRAHRGPPTLAGVRGSNPSARSMATILWSIKVSLDESFGLDVWPWTVNPSPNPTGVGTRPIAEY